MSVNCLKLSKYKAQNKCNTVLCFHHVIKVIVLFKAASINIFTWTTGQMTCNVRKVARTDEPTENHPTLRFISVLQRFLASLSSLFCFYNQKENVAYCFGSVSALSSTLFVASGSCFQWKSLPCTKQKTDTVRDSEHSGTAEDVRFIYYRIFIYYLYL